MDFIGAIIFRLQLNKVQLFQALVPRIVRYKYKTRERRAAQRKRKRRRCTDRPTWNIIRKSAPRPAARGPWRGVPQVAPFGGGRGRRRPGAGGGGGPNVRPARRAEPPPANQRMGAAGEKAKSLPLRAARHQQTPPPCIWLQTCRGARLFSPLHFVS